MVKHPTTAHEGNEEMPKTGDERPVNQVDEQRLVTIDLNRRSSCRVVRVRRLSGKAGSDLI